MNLVLDFLSELVPRFLTETYAFIKINSEELECIGRLVDLDDDEEFDVTMEVSGLGWLFFRVLTTIKPETYKDYSKGETDE